MRQAPLDAEDLVAAPADVGVDAVRAALRGRFPAVHGAEDLVDELLDLHTPRQLVGLAAIIDRIESDLRAAPVLAALRLAFLHTILPASRLALGARAGRRRCGSRAGTSKLPAPDAVARAQPVARLRGRGSGWCAASSSGSRAAPSARSRPGSARTCAASGRAPRRPSWPSPSPSGLRLLRDERPLRAAAACRRRGVRLVLGQPPCGPASSGCARPTTRPRGSSGARPPSCSRSTPSPGRRSARRGAGRPPPSAARSRRRRRPWPATGGRSSSSSDGGPEALAAAVLGGAGAGYRLVSARLADGDDDIGGSSSSCRRASARPPGPRTRANVSLPSRCRAAAGDPDLVPGPRAVLRRRSASTSARSRPRRRRGR